MKEMKLNVGSGLDYRKGWVNLDNHPDYKKDVNFDIDGVYQGRAFPFKDKKFDKIIMYDVLEHFSEPLPILRELYRLCKVGGTIKIKVPYGKSVWINLDHKREFYLDSFNVNNFDYYCSDNTPKIKLIHRSLYILPIGNVIKRNIYNLFLMTINPILKKNVFIYDQTLVKEIFPNTNIYIKYKRLK